MRILVLAGTNRFNCEPLELYVSAEKARKRVRDLEKQGFIAYYQICENVDDCPIEMIERG